MQVVYPITQVAGSAVACWPEEPLFWAEGFRRIRFHPSAHGPNLATFLTHRVNRNPPNLLAQVQRVGLQLEQADEDALYGALLDLFLVLGQNKGAFAMIDDKGDLLGGRVGEKTNLHAPGRLQSQESP